jgi:hypothetical protein
MVPSVFIVIPRDDRFGTDVLVLPDAGDAV